MHCVYSVIPSGLREQLFKHLNDSILVCNGIPRETSRGKFRKIASYVKKWKDRIIIEI